MTRTTTSLLVLSAAVVSLAASACVSTPMADSPSAIEKRVAPPAGGAAVKPVVFDSGEGGDVSVKAHFAVDAGYAIQSTLIPYQAGDVNHVVFKLSRLVGSSYIAVKDASNNRIQFDYTPSPVGVFNQDFEIAGLMPSSQYRITAFAYKDTGTAAADLISKTSAAATTNFTTNALAGGNQNVTQALALTLILIDKGATSQFDDGLSACVDDQFATAAVQCQTFTAQNPAIAAGATGDPHFAVWEDNRDGSTKIWGQLLEADGSSAAEPFSISTNAGPTTAASPSIAYASGSSSFVVTWVEFDGANYQVKACGVPATGAPAGSVFNVSNSDALDKRKPVLAYKPADDRCLVAWEENSAGTGRNIVMRLVNTTATTSALLTDTTSTVLTAIPAGDQVDPALAFNVDSGNFELAYCDMNVRAGDIYLHRISSTATTVAVVSNRKDVNSSVITGTTAQTHPAIIHNSAVAAQSIVVWQDDQAGLGTSDLYYQKLTSVLGFTGANLRVLSTGGKTMSNAKLALNTDANEFVLSWTEGNDLYFERRSGSAFTAFTSDAPASVDDTAEVLSGSAVAYNADTNDVLFAWGGNRGATPSHLYYRRLNSKLI